MITISENYTVHKFFQYCGSPKRNKHNNTYQGCCPICREGKSWLKKRRCFYIPENNNIYCHNCGFSGTPFSWIKKVSGSTDYEIIQDVKQQENQGVLEIVTIAPIKRQVEDLPIDSIDLFDEQQMSFYKDNQVVQQCLAFLHERKIDKAVNRPKSIYVSLKDFVHKNRLVIPFYNEHNKVEFYQTRTVITNENYSKPKYISKVGGDKTLYGVNKIDAEHPNVYIFEGPINAMFMQNGVAVAGIQKGGQQFTTKQKTQVETLLKFHKRVWVLDSQWIDNTSLVKTEKLLNQNESVFIWPDRFGKCFKDFNEMTMKYDLNSISWSFVLNNTFDKLTSLIMLTEIKKYANLTGSGISGRVKSLSSL